jgi:membrane fusion protein
MSLPEGAEGSRPIDIRAASAGPGVPLRDVGPTIWYAVGFYAIVAATILTFLISSSYARKVELQGVLAPRDGLAEVFSAESGTITELYAKEGLQVKAGAPLATVSVDRFERDAAPIGGLLDEANTARERAAGLSSRANNLALAKERADVLTRIESNRQEARLLATQHDFALSRVGRARERLASIKTLLGKGYVSNIQVQQLEDALTEYQIQVVSIEQQQADARRTQAQLALEMQDLAARATANEAATAEAAAGLLEKRAAAAAQRSLTLVAPRDGRIAALAMKQGERVSAGGVLATIAPNNLRLRAEFNAPSRAIGFIRPGDSVRLKFAAFPYEVFGFGKGRVETVSDAPIRVPTAAGGGEGEAEYAVRVALDQGFVHGFDRDWPLMPGMKVEGVVTLERRSLLQWLLAPALAARARAST